jgi:hypothetical protein
MRRLSNAYFMVGKAGGNIAAGQHYRNPNAGNVDAPRVLLTAVRAVGVQREQLGQPGSDAPRVVTQTIGELEA